MTHKMCSVCGEPVHFGLMGRNERCRACNVRIAQKAADTREANRFPTSARAKAGKCQVGMAARLARARAAAYGTPDPIEPGAGAVAPGLVLVDCHMDFRGRPFSVLKAGAGGHELVGLGYPPSRLPGCETQVFIHYPDGGPLAAAGMAVSLCMD